MNPLEYIPLETDTSALEHFKLFNSMQMAFVISGVIVTSYFFLRVIDIVGDLWLRNPIPVESFGAHKGFWAVVTGCTDGIGRELAVQLGELGYNLVLLSRTQSKLDDIEQQLVMMGIKVDSYAVDFSKITEADWKHIREMITSKKIGVLVNNVGVCHPATVKFMEESEDFCSEMVNVNINTTMNMTRFVVPQMRQQKNGLILNIGSWTSMKGFPFLSVYAGTKGFVKTYSESLAHELKPEGITVEHIFSFWVSSKMSGYKSASVTIPSPSVYAHHVLSHIGLRCGTLESYSSIPYAPHSYLGFVSTVMWDNRITPPALYSIANNLYQLSLKRHRRNQLKKPPSSNQE
ncbi:NAD(P)-binding protein [Coemansia reversa NRRL 1564]|uniref:NAD(P)-binding protein n=1 Tax=Coemansia reversa (strain ATCC 12441 / NRRL 1564) TaxID=763665 RepID=A0A2G5B5F2_COERN|nr:NAD(P)-binding protein [Coemansia reversa NRRL 1564]|eukprot:PIA14273.1 NAD(P)-binding protein [Coemansia reversa NRRL 1564]